MPYPPSTPPVGWVAPFRNPPFPPPAQHKSKTFFFKKKQQKTFIHLGECWFHHLGPNSQKFFGSFFQKRTFFPSFFWSF